MALALAVVAGLVGCGDAQLSGSDEPITFTWLGVSHWLVETPAGSALLDAYASRPPFSERGPTTEGLELFRAIEVAAKPPPPIRWIAIGHSHFDHAMDVGPLALETGAQVIGSRTTCLVAESQGVARDKCTAVRGGETIRLDSRLSLRVVRIPHSSPDSIGLFSELAAPPENAVAVPNGGNLGFLFEIDDGPSWFYVNSIAPIGSDDGSGVDFVGALANVFDDDPRPDVWLAAPFGSTGTLDPYLDVVSPGAFVPHHWDGLFPVLADGPPGAYVDDALRDSVARRGADFLVPTSYLEQVVHRDGRTRLEPNQAVRDAVGVP